MTDNKKDLEKVSVDTPNCISCGACLALCSEVFKFDNTNKIIVQKQPRNEDELMCSKQAEAACPVAIIHVKD